MFPIELKQLGFLVLTEKFAKQNLSEILNVQLGIIIEW